MIQIFYFSYKTESKMKKLESILNKNHFTI